MKTQKGTVLEVDRDASLVTVPVPSAVNAFKLTSYHLPLRGSTMSLPPPPGGLLAPPNTFNLTSLPAGLSLVPSEQWQVDRNGVDFYEKGKKITNANATLQINTKKRDRSPSCDDNNNDTNTNTNEDSCIKFNAEAAAVTEVTSTKTATATTGTTSGDECKELRDAALALCCDERKPKTRKGSTFDKRCDELAIFIKTFGHCDVPRRCSANPALGRWCSDLRQAYNQLKRGEKPTKALSEEGIAHLDKIGFKWVGSVRTAFDRRFDELVEFNNRHGNCDVHQNSSENPALGIWCNHLRYAYQQIQKGNQPRRDLSKLRIQKLENLGFQWYIG